MAVRIVLRYITIIKHSRDSPGLPNSIPRLSVLVLKKREECVFLCSCFFDFEMCATFSPTYSYQSITASHLEHHTQWLTLPKHILHSLPFLWHLNSRSNRKKPIKFNWLTKNPKLQVDETSVKIHNVRHFVNS